MASLFTLRSLMALATKIGANPNKFMGTKTNISFLGKGPTKNPLFQRPVAGLENASVQQLGKRESIVEAVEDAMSYASSGKLNTIQTEILGKNLLGLKNIYHPPVLPTLPTATITKLPTRGSGIMGAKKTTAPFTGWTPKVVPKGVNIPASKVNHQMIADKYGIDVELIKGKNWTEVLEIIKNLGYAEGGLANVMQTPRRGRVTHPGGYAGIGKRQAFINLARAGGSRQDFIDLAASYGIQDPFKALMNTGHDDERSFTKRT